MKKLDYRGIYEPQGRYPTDTQRQTPETPTSPGETKLFYQVEKSFL